MKNIFKNKLSFGTFLNILITLSTALIIFFVSLYYSKYITKMTADYDNNLRVYVSTLIFGSYAYDYQEGNFSDTSRIVNDLKKHNIIHYVYVFNKETGQIVWSSNPNWSDLGASELKKYLESQHDKDKVTETIYNAPKYHYTIVIGNVKNAMMPVNSNPFFINTGMFLLISLIIGFLASLLVSAFIMKQIKILRYGSQEYAHKNFSYRFDETTFREFLYC